MAVVSTVQQSALPALNEAHRMMIGPNVFIVDLRVCADSALQMIVPNGFPQHSCAHKNAPDRPILPMLDGTAFRLKSLKFKISIDAKV